jgi:glycosyltransferase involved in cell wall biosynthesis
MTEPRSALVVVNGLNEPSGIVRATQYASHFDRSSQWRASFISRRSQKWTARSNRTYRPTAPLVVPLIHRPVAAYTRRWERRREDEIVRLAGDVDLVYLVKVPRLALYQRLRALNRPTVIADLNDGLWLPQFQRSGWQDLDEILRTSHGVICENSYVAGYARRMNPNVAVVPDAPQVEVFDQRRPEIGRGRDRVALGWLGSPENAGALFRIFEPLEAVARRVPNWHLRVVGAGHASVPRFECVNYSCRPSYGQDEMIREALAFDVGLFPMFHVEEGLARGTLKAMIYMSAGAVAMCEDYGENRALIEDGVNGVLAGTADEWAQKLERLVTDRSLRDRIAQRGLETIRRHFAADVVFAQLESAFTQLSAGTTLTSRAS